MSNKEIEFGLKINNPQEVLACLQGLAQTPKEIEITRDIYKNSGKFFVKFSVESTNGHKQYLFSLKEDLVTQGITEGMKEAIEIDLETDEAQFEKLRSIIEYLGFKKESTFHKLRKEFNVEGLKVTLDDYSTKFYLEIEGESREKILNFARRLPIDAQQLTTR